MARAAKTTTDHDEIRRWVEARGGHPAHVAQSAGRNDPGILRIDYPGFSGEDTLEPIEWDEFFEQFDRNNLAFLYQDAKNSRFSKFVERAATKRSSTKKRSASSARKATASKKSASTKKSATTKKASSKKAAKRSAASSKKSTSKKSTSKKSASRKTAAKKSSSKKSSKHR